MKEIEKDPSIIEKICRRFVAFNNDLLTKASRRKPLDYVASLRCGDRELYDLLMALSEAWHFEKLEDVITKILTPYWKCIKVNEKKEGILL